MPDGRLPDGYLIVTRASRRSTSRIACASLRIELKNTGTTAVEFIAGKPIVRIGC